MLNTTALKIAATALLISAASAASASGLVIGSDPQTDSLKMHPLSLQDMPLAAFVDAFGKHHDLSFIGEPSLANSERVMTFYETPPPVVSGEQEPLQHFAPLLQMAGFDLCPLKVTHDDALIVHTDQPLRIVEAKDYDLRMMYPPATVTAGKHVDTWLGNDVRTFPSACREGLPPSEDAVALSNVNAFSAALPRARTFTLSSTPA
nr:hypothetical protein [uncultured Halomonas sp.]